MPRLKDVRFVGIQLDEGKKIIPDITWSPNEKNMLFLLENGGGKTSYIQLLLQTVLPNAMLGKRELKKTLKKNSHGHIVTSWKMDGDNDKYLCTGFAFRNAENDKESLEYFTYLFTYDEDSDYTIHHLPLKQDQKVTKYHELKTYLKKLDVPFIQVFETKTAYQSALKLFGILPEEWESIRKINGDEGGVAEFFDKAKTTKTLIEKLLIPTIEDTLFQGKEGKNEIFRSYQSYKENLIRIPDMKKDLQDFRVIEEKAEQVVDVVEQYTVAKEGLTSGIELMQRFLNTIARQKEQLHERVQTLEHEIQRHHSTLEELHWKEKSFSIHQVSEELKQQKAILAIKKNEKEAVDQQIASLEKKEEEMKAMQHYERYLQAFKHAEEKKIQISLLSESEPELKRVLEQAKIQLQQSWSYLLHEKQQKHRSKETAITTLKERKEATSTQLKTMRKTIGDLANALSEKRAIQSECQKEERQIESKFGKKVAVNPVQSLSDFEREQNELVEREQTYKQDLVEITRLLEHNRQKERAVQEESNEIKAQQQEWARKKEDYTKKKTQLLAQLTVFQKHELDPFQEKTRLLRYFEEKTDELNGLKDQLTIDIGDLNKDIQRLASHDYFVPHSLLLEVKERLEKDGLFVSLGSEWLAEQVISEEAKQAYLSNYPLLPYSILVEEQQLSLLKKSVSKFKEAAEIPFIFQLKNQLENKEGAQETFHHLNEKGTLVYQTLGIDLFTSKDEMENMIRRLKEQLHTKQVSLAHYKTELGTLEDAGRLLRSFFEEFDENTYPFYERKWNECVEQIHACNETILALRREKITMEENEAQTKNALEIVTMHGQALSLTIQELRSFIERYPNQANMIAEIKQLQEEINRQTNQKEQLENEFDQLGERIESAIQEKEQARTDFYSFKQEGLTLGLQEEHTTQDPCTMSDYDRHRSTYKSAEEQLGGKMKAISTLQELLHVFVEQTKMEEKEIKKLHHDMEHLHTFYYVVRDEELEKVQNQLTSQRVALKQTEQEYIICETTVASVSSKMDTLVNALREGYAHINEMPYAYGDNAEKEYQAYCMEIEQINERMNTVNKAKDEVDKQLADVHTAFVLAEDIQLGTDETAALLSEEEVSVLGRNFTEALKKAKEDYTAHHRSYLQAREKTEKAFKKYEDQLQETNNPKVKKVARDINEAVIQTGKMYEVDYVLDVFSRFFDAIESMRSHYQTQLSELEKDKENLVHLSYQRVQTMYENIIEIPKHSKIELYGKHIQMIRIDWQTETEEMAKANIRRFVESLLEDVQLMKKEGTPDGEIDLFMKNQLSIIKLLSNLADIERCKITIFKPRKETMVQSGVDYYPWDIAASWSGGEGYTSYMAMFMTLITHIRKKTTAKENAWKTIVADNPFGKASSHHVVKPMIELAAKNKIQLFCLTAIKEEGIRSHFDIIASNRYYNQGGVEILSTQHKQGLQGMAPEKMANLTIEFK